MKWRGDSKPHTCLRLHRAPWFPALPTVRGNPEPAGKNESDHSIPLGSLSGSEVIKT